MKYLNSKIESILKEHLEGCSKIFDALDMMIRSDIDILKAFTHFVDDNLVGFGTNRQCGVVLSGNFGMALINTQLSWLTKTFNDIIIVSGDIRNGVEPEIYRNNGMQMSDNYVFLDDSFYSGKTRDNISKAIGKVYGTIGQSINQTFVIYDGSKKSKNVASMFKYYNEQIRY